MANVLPEHLMHPVDAQRGVLVLVVGPSGSGKDTLISWLRERLSLDRRVMFVRRTVTRPADANSEEHVSLDEAAFLDTCARGGFAVTWSAHGHQYGLPVSALHHVRNGGLAIANGARRALDDIEAVFGNVVIVRLGVEEGVLRERLRSRGREGGRDIEQRLKAAAMPLDTHLPIIEIDNSGPIDEAGYRFLRELDRLLKYTAQKSSAMKS